MLDLRLACRSLLRAPSLSAVALFSLSVAIAVATAAFSVVHGAFLSDLPLPRSDRLVIVQDYDKAGRFNVPMTAATFDARRRRSQSFEGAGAWYSRSVTIEPAGGGQPVVLRAAFVSPEALSTAGLPIRSGRLPRVEDAAAGAMPVVVLGHRAWRQLGEAGTTIDIAGRIHRVIGVVSDGVRFPIKEDLWIPVQVDPLAGNATPEGLTMFGVLKPGVSAERAAAELTAISVPMAGAESAASTVAIVMPFARGFLSPEAEIALYAGVAGLVLFLIVIATNLSNLFFARNSARAREIAVRAALGASRAQLMRPLLFEALILGGVSAVAALGLARVLVGWFVAQVEDVPWWADFSLNPVVLGFAALMAVVASIVAGLSPAMRLSRVTAGATLKQGTTGAGLRFSRGGATLLSLQLAISVGCLSVVMVLAQSLFGFSFQQYGVTLDAERVLITQVYLGPPDEEALSAPGADRRSVWREHYSKSQRQFDRIRTELMARPGVREVTYSTHFPGNDAARAMVEIGATEGGTARINTHLAEVGPRFFETLGASLVGGRDFSEAERHGPVRSVIVNEPFARKHFGGANPIGRVIRVIEAGATESGPWLEVVGVAPDLGLNPGEASLADGIYVPFSPSSFTRFGVRTAGETSVLTPVMHELVRRENVRGQVQASESLAALMRATESVFQGLGGGLAILGGTALLLSAVSFYSLVSFGVTRRTREIAIQIALGATRGRILRAIFARELRVMLSGALGGVLIGALLYQAVRQMPFDLGPAAPSLAFVAIGLITFVGAGAYLAPARRALRIQPAEALRRD